LIAETEKARPSAQKFVGENSTMEDSLKTSTIGLVKLEDYTQKRLALEEQAARDAARTSELKCVLLNVSYIREDSDLVWRTV
jgi:protein FAM50